MCLDIMKVEKHFFRIKFMKFLLNHWQGLYFNKLTLNSAELPILPPASYFARENIDYATLHSYTKR